MVFLIGFIGILITVIGHALTTSFLLTGLMKYAQKSRERFGDSDRTWVLAASACLLGLKHAVDIVIWAAFFWFLDGPQFINFEEAVYFSSVTYTTLGYGDVVIQGPGRLLCTYEAISGTILFGLSTALLFTLVNRLWIRPLDDQVNG